MKKTILLILGFFFLFGCQTTPPEVETPPVATIEPTKTPLPTPTVAVTPTPAIDLHAVLQEVKGGVEAKPRVDLAYISATDGTQIEEHGEARTLEDGYTRVDLSTGTLIRMAPLSHFVLESNEAKDKSLLTRIKLELGQLWVVLKTGIVEIETSSGVAAVRGSYMMVEIDPETQAAFISCLEGHCTLENPAGIVELVSGERARLMPPELTQGDFILPTIEAMQEIDFAEWLFYAPEAEDIFPLLAEENILPWENWEEYLPEEDGSNPKLEAFLAEHDRLLDQDGDGILDGDGLLDGDGGGILDGDRDGPLGGGGDGPLDGDGPLGGDGDGPLDGGGPLGGG